ncbi:MAG: hypothetical protein FJX00_03805, partial [Alphaproteobacteria bacterium]|nr:hypothetical protein [Alphaproteobacteria bacterium]
MTMQKKNGAKSVIIMLQAALILTVMAADVEATEEEKITQKRYQVPKSKLDKKNQTIYTALCNTVLENPKIFGPLIFGDKGEREHPIKDRRKVYRKILGNKFKDQTLKDIQFFGLKDIQDEEYRQNPLQSSNDGSEDSSDDESKNQPLVHFQLNESAINYDFGDEDQSQETLQKTLEEQIFIQKMIDLLSKWTDSWTKLIDGMNVVKEVNVVEKEK